MNTFFLDTNKQLPDDDRGQPFGNVEEKEFILKSNSTSAIGSDHCVEDSYIIQNKQEFDDDVRSLYLQNRDSQKEPAINIDDEIQSLRFFRDEPWSTKSRRNSILGDQEFTPEQFNYTYSPQVKQHKTFEPQTDNHLDYFAQQNNTINFDDFFVSTNPFSASPRMQKEYPYGCQMTSIQDENQEPNELSPQHFQNACIDQNVGIEYSQSLLDKSLSDASYTLMKPSLPADQSECSNSQSREAFQSRGPFRTDAFMKQIVRYFREQLKQNFKDTYGKRYYNWKPDTLRTKVRDFFTSDRGGQVSYNVPSRVFEQHEHVFFRLIFNTKKDEEIRQDYGITVDTDFSKKMNEVFGSRPSLSNLRSFFTNEAIQGLWNNGFAVAAESSIRVYRGVIQEDICLRNSLQKLSPINKKKLYKHCEKFAPAGFDVLP